MRRSCPETTGLIGTIKEAARGTNYKQLLRIEDDAGASTTRRPCRLMSGHALSFSSLFKTQRGAFPAIGSALHSRNLLLAR